MNVIEHYFNKLSTHSRNKLLFLYLDTKGEKFPSLFSGFVFHDNRSLLIKFYLNVLNFLVNDMIRIRLGFFYQRICETSIYCSEYKKATHKDKRLNAVLMKKILSTRACYSLSDKNLELFDITANTVSICMILIWLKSKNQI